MKKKPKISFFLFDKELKKKFYLTKKRKNIIKAFIIIDTIKRKKCTGFSPVFLDIKFYANSEFFFIK